MKLPIKYIALLLLISWHAQAQEQAQEQEQETKYAIKLDSTTHNKWTPTGIRVGFDIAGPIYNFLEPSISNYEGTADIDFGKFFGVIEVGRGAYKSQGAPTTLYTSSGFFYRIGADVNMTPRDTKLNVLYFGLRYATSSFNETLYGEQPSEGWGIEFINKEQDKSSTNWVEMNIGLRVRISNSIFTGYTLRFKLLKHNRHNEGEFETYFIPGYGVASNTVNWGISYYVQYRFAWKKKPIRWKEN